MRVRGNFVALISGRRPDKENVPSRAYIVFKTDEQVATFGKEYDGHLFRDKAGA